MSGARGYLDGEAGTITGSFDDGEKRGWDVLMDDGKERWFCGMHRWSTEPPAPRAPDDATQRLAVALAEFVKPRLLRGLS